MVLYSHSQSSVLLVDLVRMWCTCGVGSEGWATTDRRVLVRGALVAEAAVAAEAPREDAAVVGARQRVVRAAAHLGFGRIVASEIDAPNMFANLV